MFNQLTFSFALDHF